MILLILPRIKSTIQGDYIKIRDASVKRPHPLNPPLQPSWRGGLDHALDSPSPFKMERGPAFRGRFFMKKGEKPYNLNH
jgi:hypothetical protein